MGADAGFAAIIGLALLMLLYFAQARETSSLRRHADEATARIGQLEARIVQLTRAPSAAPQAQAARPPVSVGAVATGPIAARALAPAAPAGVAAPALAAATRLIPSARPASAAPAAVAEPVAAPRPSLADRAAAGDRRGRGERLGHRRAAPAGLGDVGCSEPARHRAPGRSAKPQAAGGFGWPRPTGSRAVGLSPRPRVALGALGVVAVVVVLLYRHGGARRLELQLWLDRDPGEQCSARPSGRAAVNPRRSRSLSSTARRPTASLTGSRNISKGRATRRGPRGTPRSDPPTTIVAYLPGFKRDAEAVAATLKLGPSVVQPVDQNTQSVACAGANPCTANVVVTVGANLQNTP